MCKVSLDQSAQWQRWTHLKRMDFLGTDNMTLDVTAPALSAVQLRVLTAPFPVCSFRPLPSASLPVDST